MLNKLSAKTKARLNKLWADGAYNGSLIDWLHEQLDAVLEIVQRDRNQKGLQLLPQRWVVECTFA